MTKLKIGTGFTLVELLVTISIVAVIMSVILFGYSSLNDGLNISSADQEISLAIRQAQTYGLSVRGTSNVFGYAYGVSFDTADPTNYYIFVDTDNNGRNSNSGTCTGECVEQVTLRNGVRITGICGASLVSSALNCATGATSMHITFLRPSPDAVIQLYNGTTLIGSYYRGQVKVTSVNNKVGTITVDKTGQIYVQ